MPYMPTPNLPASARASFNELRRGSPTSLRQGYGGPPKRFARRRKLVSRAVARQAAAETPQLPNSQSGGSYHWVKFVGFGLSVRLTSRWFEPPSFGSWEVLG